ncbi:poly-histidine-tagged ubiquitin [Chrysochromulina tobinii]|uniref:Poly-histidine-tagged ubiquitin n=1 Tax=Chrysochromulina tobinii TaxID=1460289 RepID=A0A0M0JEK0_9EUKA|nr:poly-histidine-tagged ubiquitin [Chrysochromulina tobinii]|eukprot:KOO25006.1 poly-histidine-tagged ubiquitin [Chrysochromulina sp. CCMP291]
MEVTVKSIEGVALQLAVEPTTPISKLKDLVEQSGLGVPADQQRLIYGGKLLEDERTLADHSVDHDATFHLLVRPRGGTAYLCGDCGQTNEIKPKDPIRCRFCGYRILYKMRTKNLIQFEAR